MSTKTPSAFDLDIRVRERNLKSGNLSEKDLEKFLGGLPDLADAAEPVSLAQPALAAEEDLVDDEDDEDDEDETDAPAIAAAPAPAPAQAAPAPVAAAPVEPAPAAPEAEPASAPAADSEPSAS